MSDDTRQARIEAGYEALTAKHIEEYGRAFPWIKAGSSWGFEVRQMVASVLDAADAVGRERVSETGIEDRVFAFEKEIDSYNLANDCGDARARANAHRKLIKLYREALLTAAPPERHDAPGVTVEWLDEEISYTQRGSMSMVDEVFNKGKAAAFREVRALLTGQPDAEQCIHRIGAPACRKGLGCGCMRGEAPELPDAGRDPDAADAGGE